MWVLRFLSNLYVFYFVFSIIICGFWFCFVVDRLIIWVVEVVFFFIFLLYIFLVVVLNLVYWWKMWLLCRKGEVEFVIVCVKRGRLRMLLDFVIVCERMDWLLKNWLDIWRGFCVFNVWDVVCRVENIFFFFILDFILKLIKLMCCF